VDEVVARVKSHLRREDRGSASNDQKQPLVSAGEITINKDTYSVFKNGVLIDLSTKEFQILAYLIQNKNRVLSREQIYESVWGYDDFGDVNTVTVHLKNIRIKLDNEHQYIKTIWGAGYKFSC
jgi:DNA-binding response OmpR family regulator